MNPLSQTSALVLACDKGKSYPSSKAKEFLSHLDLSKGQSLYDKIRHLQPHLDEVIPNRKFLIHNYIRKILKESGASAQVLTLACGWDPFLIKMSEEFPKNRFFGVDSESVELQERLAQKIMPDAPIFYIHADIANVKHLIQQLSAKGWSGERATCIIVEGISYYIPPKIFWESLSLLKRSIQADCFICGDFLLDWTQQEVSQVSQKLAVEIFDMIKEACSQNYYLSATRQMRSHLHRLGFSKIHFFTQDQMQKRRAGSSWPWKAGEGHIQLFTAQHKL